MNRITKVEIRVTKPHLYPADCQNVWHQQGYYFVGRTYDDCLEQAHKEHGKKLSIRTTRKWNQDGDLIYRVNNQGKQTV